jgi:hypothetical protein
MKTIVLIRHGSKTADGKHITEECLQNIRKNGIESINSITINRIQLGTEFVRTRETAEAYKDYLANFAASKYMAADIDPMPELFSAEMNNRFWPNGWDNPKSGQTVFAAWEENADPNLFPEWRKEMEQALWNLFMELDYGDICLSVGHTPVTEMMYTSFSDDNDASLKELEGVKFEMDNNGNIKATLLQ